jgi:hypothetical protein
MGKGRVWIQVAVPPRYVYVPLSRLVVRHGFYEFGPGELDDVEVSASVDPESNMPALDIIKDGRGLLSIELSWDELKKLKQKIDEVLSHEKE